MYSETSLIRQSMGLENCQVSRLSDQGVSFSMYSGVWITGESKISSTYSNFYLTEFVYLSIE